MNKYFNRHGMELVIVCAGDGYQVQTLNPDGSVEFIKWSGIGTYADAMEKTNLYVDYANSSSFKSDLKEALKGEAARRADVSRAEAAQGKLEQREFAERMRARETDVQKMREFFKR